MVSVNECEYCGDMTQKYIVHGGPTTGHPTGEHITSLRHVGRGEYCLPNDIIHVPYRAKCDSYNGSIKEVYL